MGPDPERGLAPVVAMRQAVVAMAKTALFAVAPKAPRQP